MKRAFIGVLVSILMSSCAAFVPVVDVNSVPKETKQEAYKVRAFTVNSERTISGSDRVERDINQLDDLVRELNTPYRTHIRTAIANVSSVYRYYSTELQSVISETDLVTLEALYREWTANRKIEVVRQLIELQIPLSKMADLQTKQELRNFSSRVYEVLQKANQVPQGSAEDQLRFLYLNAFRLRFVFSLPEAQERITAIDARIPAAKKEAALDREVNSIVASLSQNAGRADDVLEQKIAALPSDRQRIVRTEQERAIQEETQRLRREEAVRRKTQIEEAIALRKQEIDTEHPNPVAQEQRKADSALAKSVAEWEVGYRSDIAKKKAEEQQRLAAAREQEAQRLQAERDREAQRLQAQRKAQAEADFRRSSLAKSLRDELETLEKQIAKVQQERKQALEQTPEVQIVGRVVDRERDHILVWGVALPISGPANAFGVLLAESNIIVYNPDPTAFRPEHYVRGTHYFVRKTVGTNAFGAGVPVWVYGNAPPHLQALTRRWMELHKAHGDASAKYSKAESEFVAGRLARN